MSRFSDYGEHTFNQQYKKTLFRANRYALCEDFNDLQNTIFYQLKKITDNILNDGDIIEGATITINKITGGLLLSKGQIYTNGYISSIESRSDIIIPLDQKVVVGAFYKETEIDETQDIQLVGNILETETYGSPAASRLHIDIKWGAIKEDNSLLGADSTYTKFFPIYVVDSGVISVKANYNSIKKTAIEEIAKYDREANGSYIVDGLGLSFLLKDSNKYIYSLTEGNANINGYKFSRLTSTRLEYTLDFEFDSIQDEPQYYSSVTKRITTNKYPINSIVKVTGFAQKTVNVIRGNIANGIDELPDASVSQVLEVKQGSTVYVVGTDFIVNGNKINWGSSAEEPLVGTTYQVKYNYTVIVTPTSLDNYGFSLDGLVDGSQVFIDYTWKLPRKDLLALSSIGDIVRIKGISRLKNAIEPTLPSNHLALASISYDWINDPIVKNTGLITMTVDNLRTLEKNLNTCVELISSLQLNLDSVRREPSSIKTLFSDSFLNDKNRDIGVQQSAAIFSKSLNLPISYVVNPLTNDNNKKINILNYTEEAVVNQIKKTGAMKINPYMAFDPIPAKITLVQAVDNWTETQTAWASPLTQRFVEDLTGGRGWHITQTSDNTVDELISSSIVDAEYIRPQTVLFTVENFGPGETLQKILFDGRDVSPSVLPVANSSGVITGSFQIPVGILTGSKEVIFQGQFSTGTTLFIAKGEITNELRRMTRTVVVRGYDPLAQTFTLNESRIVTSVDIEFTAKGASKDVYVQIREVDLGFPTKTVITEGVIKYSDIVIGGWKKCQIDPCYLEAGKEYAIVILTDDGVHEVAVASLGEYDVQNGWIKSQPYQTGVLLSSSNASTWTAHQNTDLKFRLNAGIFTTEKTINLGSITIDNSSDFLFLSGIEKPSYETNAEIILIDSNNVQYVISEESVLNLTTKISGPLSVQLKLYGTPTLSPIVYPGSQLVSGELLSSGDYYSRYLIAKSTFNMTVIASVYEPNSSSVDFYVENTNANSFVQLSLDNSEIIEANWVEKTFKITGVHSVGSDLLTRIKIVLNGGPDKRCKIKNLRVIIL